MLIKNQIGYLLSLPSRGAWIEIKIVDTLLITPLSRSPRGERG